MTFFVVSIAIGTAAIAVGAESSNGHESSLSVLSLGGTRVDAID